MKNINNWVRSALAVCLTVAIFATSSMMVLATPGKNSSMGELFVAGQYTDGDAPFVTLNGERAYSGRTVYSSSTIVTSETSNATINLGKLGSVTLPANSNLTLNFSENTISGILTAGQVKVANAPGVKVEIQTLDSVVSNDSQKSIFDVNIQSGKTLANAENGSVYLNNGTETIPVSGPQTSSGKNNKYWVPIIIFAGVVAATSIYVLTNDDDETGPAISPVR
jgi:hypothetical protein